MPRRRPSSDSARTQSESTAWADHSTTTQSACTRARSITRSYVTPGAILGSHHTEKPSASSRWATRNAAPRSERP